MPAPLDPIRPRVRPAGEIVPIGLWSVSHWMTLAYIERIMAEFAGMFQIGWDPRMRQSCRHYQRMLDECPRPMRITQSVPGQGYVMERHLETRLSDGSRVELHDDWDCVRDMVAAGLFVDRMSGVRAMRLTEFRPKEVLKFSGRGLELCTALRTHRAKVDGTLRSFRAGPAFQNAPTSETSQAA